MSVFYKGIELETCEAEEQDQDIEQLSNMKSAVDRVPSEIISYIKCIFCSSIPESVFCVVVNSRELSDDLKYLVNASFNRMNKDKGTFLIQNWRTDLHGA